MAQGRDAARAYLEKSALYKARAEIARSELEHLNRSGQPFLNMYGPKYARIVRKNEAAWQHAAGQISALDNPLHRELLSAYYLQGRTLEQIADALFYTAGYMRISQSRALDAFYRQHLAAVYAQDDLSKRGYN